MSRMVKRMLIALQDLGPGSKNEKTFAIAHHKSQEDITSARLIKPLHQQDRTDIVFEFKETVGFTRAQVYSAIAIQCREEKNRLIVSKKEYKEKWSNVVGDIKSEESEPQRHDRDYNGSDDEEDQQGSANHNASNRRRGRPKGSKNRRRVNNVSYSESDEEDADEEVKRGRGRPRGSRNKRNQKQPSYADKQDIKSVLNSHLRGRTVQSPESSKPARSKPLPSLREQSYSKAAEYKQDKEKRARGRPKGVKNKPKNCFEESQKSEYQEEYILPLPLTPETKQLPCCERCNDRSLKQSLVNASVKQATSILQKQDIKNIWLDFSMENRTNVVIEIIKKNDPDLFRLLLTKINQFKPYFVCSWEFEQRIETQNHTVKTKKIYLSHTGKEGNHALLHDCDIIPGVWWKQIGIIRLLQNISNDTGIQMVQMLENHSQELKRAIYENIPTLVRSGNYQASRHLIQKIVVQNNNLRYGYNREHIQCLNPSNSNIPFRKTNILKQNFTANFCSPIHCACVNPNPQLLENILKCLNDYPVGDSLSRKPIHYAVLCKNTGHIQILLNHDSDLKDTDKLRITPLMVASMHDKSNIVQYILSKHSDTQYVNFRSEEGFSALHYAIIRQNLKCVRVLLQCPSININLETRDRLTPLHLAAGNQSSQIVKELIQHGAYLDSIDRHKRTPLMFAVRNNNITSAMELLNNGAKYYRRDTSLNSMLHYAAAYGNTWAIGQILPIFKQDKNKRGYYPLDIAVGKGHMGCAKLLDQIDSFQFSKYQPQHNMCFLNMKNIRYTPESMGMIKYLLEKYYNPDEVDVNGSKLLHYVCSFGKMEYVRLRETETGLYDQQQQFKQEFAKLQQQLINLLQQIQNSADFANKKGETPVTLCVEKENMIGLKLLVQGQLNLEFESSSGFTLLHYFSHLASQSLEGVVFVLERLVNTDKNMLKGALKKTDINGFQAILFFVKDFVYKVKDKFNRRVQYHIDSLADDPQTKAFCEYKEHEEQFVKLMCMIMELGCDVNVVVQDRKKEEEGQNFKKWGVLHFLMKFPSLVLLNLFKNKIRNFNCQNTHNMTPLHLFCQWVKQGFLFEVPIGVQHEDYIGERSLAFLLENSCFPNSLDTNRSIPLLYAALNRQISFVDMLRKFGSIINYCNNCNQVPFTQIIKMKNHFTFQEIQAVLKMGADPKMEDLHKQTALHHLVYHSQNLDNSTEICRLIFDLGADINKVDKYNRTPLFYCFTKIDGDDEDEAPNDKIEILRTLLCHPEIDINHKDVFNRTALHYACEKNFFFSILYLLDKKVDMTVKDYEGNTPLAVCLKHKQLNQAALLLKRGVGFGVVVDGQTTLSYFAYAVTKLSVGICYMLLDYGYPIEKALDEVPNQEFRNLLSKKYLRSRT